MVGAVTMRRLHRTCYGLLGPILLVVAAAASACSGANSSADDFMESVSTDSEPSSETRQARWEDEMFGLVARLNDIVTFELTPALLGYESFDDMPSRDVAGHPDRIYPQVEVACSRALEVVEEMGELASNGPQSHATAAGHAVELAAVGNEAFRECVSAASATDGEQMDSLAEAFFEVSTQFELLVENLPADAQCPVGIAADVVHCTQ